MASKHSDNEKMVKVNAGMGWQHMSVAELAASGLATASEVETCRHLRRDGMVVLKSKAFVSYARARRVTGGAA